MPQFKVMAPDGTPYMVNAPDGATPEQAIAYAKTLHTGAGGGGQPNAAPEPPDKPTSQLLGAAEGAMHVFDRAAEGASHIPVVGPAVDKLGQILGLPSTDEAVDAHQQAFTEKEKTHTPGQTGKIVGEIGATLPLAAVTANPIALGAASGLLSGDEDSLGGNARDAVIGGAAGKLGDVVLRGTAALGKNLVNRYAPNVVLAATEAGHKVAGHAANFVNRLLESSGLTHDDLINAGVQSTKPLTSAEVIGKTGMTHLGALARRDGTTADTLDNLLKERSTNASSRMLDDYASASGIDPKLAAGDIEDYVTAGRRTVKPMFDQALGIADGGKSPAVWNSKLSLLANRPSVQKAMAAVAEDLKEGDINPTAMGLTAQDPATGKFTQMPRPTAEAWDLIKKRISSLGERDAFGKLIPDSLSPGNSRLNQTGRDLTGALRESISGYGDALDASGDYLGMKKAFDTGANFILNPKIIPQQVALHVSSLPDAERQAFKGGIANQLFDRAQNGRLTGSVFYRAQNGAFAPISAVARKLESALGPDNAQKFLASIETEGRMAQASARMRPGVNSPTSEYNEAIGQQDAGHNAHAEVTNFAKDILSGHGVASAGANSAGRMAVGAVDRFATRGMPVDVRNEAGRLLMMHPKDLGSYLRSVTTAPQPKGAAIINNAIQWGENGAAPVIPALAGQGAAASAAAMLEPSE